MRENRTYGSEGGEAQLNEPSLPPIDCVVARSVPDRRERLGQSAAGRLCNSSANVGTIEGVCRDAP